MGVMGAIGEGEGSGTNRESRCDLGGVGGFTFRGRRSRSKSDRNGVGGGEMGGTDGEDVDEMRRGDIEGVGGGMVDCLFFKIDLGGETADAKGGTEGEEEVAGRLLDLLGMGERGERGRCEGRAGTGGFSKIESMVSRHGDTELVGESGVSEQILRRNSSSDEADEEEPSTHSVAELLRGEMWPYDGCRLRRTESAAPRTTAGTGGGGGGGPRGGGRIVSGLSDGADATRWGGRGARRGLMKRSSLMGRIVVGGRGKSASNLDNTDEVDPPSSEAMVGASCPTCASSAPFAPSTLRGSRGATGRLGEEEKRGETGDAGTTMLSGGIWRTRVSSASSNTSSSSSGSSTIGSTVMDGAGLRPSSVSLTGERSG